MGRTFFQVDVRSNSLDLFIVTTGIIYFIVCRLFPDARKSKLSAIMRLFRMLRIVRVFRLFKMFKQLYMLAHGFAEAASAVFWVSVLGTLCLYVCAIFLTRTIGRGAFEGQIDEESEDALREEYGNVPSSMFSLFRLMANPNVEHLRSVMLNEPAAMCFFVIFVIFGSFAMLSILTGIISESMNERGEKRAEEMRFEEERKKHAFIETVRRIFEAADDNNDGTLTREEFRAQVPRLVRMFMDQGLDYKSEDMEMVFYLVDFDGGGTIELQEFLDGMASFTSNVSDLPLQTLITKSRLLRHMTEVSTKDLSDIDARFDKVFNKLDDLAKSELN